MQEKFPLVSIIIPVYNGSDFLESAIKSALNQTYKNIEIIVINDGSSDDGQTKRIALSYQERIRYLEKENGGVSSAFNLGIREMTGEYFSWLSHDDEYYPEKTQIQIETLLKYGLDKTVVFSDTDYIDKNALLVPSKSRIRNVRPSIIQFQMLTVRPLINGNTVLIPRECFDKVGFFNESLKTSQDYDMWFRLADHFRFYYIDRPLVKTRKHLYQGSRTISTFKSESWKTKIKYLNSIGSDRLILMSGERNPKSFWFKLLLRYVSFGNEGAGWPTCEVLRKCLKCKVSCEASPLQSFLDFKIIRKLAKLLCPYFLFKVEK